METMSGLRRCKKFLRDLELDKLKEIKITIVRRHLLEPDFPQPDFPQPMYRELDNPKDLIIHFKKESRKGIFEREDIIVNQDFPEVVEKQRNKSDEQNEENRTKIKYWKSPNRRRSRSRSVHSYDEKYYNRSERKRSTPSPHKRDRDHRSSNRRSPSPKPKKIPGVYIPPKSDYLRSRSRSVDSYDEKYYNRSERKRSTPSPHKRDRDHRSSNRRSPSPKPKKIPGLYIPPKSDYLRYEKRKVQERDPSNSPGPSHRKPMTRSSPRYNRRESPSERSHRRLGSPSSSSSKQRSRRSRSPSYRSNRRSRSPSRRSRSRGRHIRHHSGRSRSRSPRSSHQDRMYEDAMLSGNMPFMFQGGGPWNPYGIANLQTGFMPRGGFMPHPMCYPRCLGPPMFVPRIPTMASQRLPMYRPKIQTSADSDKAANVTESTEKVSDNVDKKVEGKDANNDKLC